MLERIEADAAEFPGGVVAECGARQTNPCAASWNVMAMDERNTQGERRRG